MIRLKSLLLAAALVCGCQPLPSTSTSTSTSARPEPVQLISAEQLREDLSTLRAAIQMRHPRFHAKPLDEALQRSFHDIEQGLDQPLDQHQAFQRLARLNPYFKDAHTLILPKLDEAAASGGAFPFRVRLDAAGALRLRNGWSRASDAATLAEGTQIVAINSMPVPQLLDILAAYGHGETPQLQRHMLGVMFADWLDSVQGWRGRFELRVIEDGRPRELVVAAADRWTPQHRDAQLFAPTLKLLDAQTALLTLPTFDVDEAPGTFDDAINAAFEQLARTQVHGLIIDVRGNTGGQSDAGAKVISYLTDRPINQVSRARERLNEENRGLFGHRGRVGDMREMDLSQDGLVQPAPQALRFRGKVVVLMDAMTYSAGILFVTTLQDHGLAVLVGQPTGGHANQTGNMQAVVLPHSRLQVYIPAREFVRPNGAQALAPVMPDLAVDPTAPGPDPVLAAARSHLSGTGVAATQNP